MPGELLTATGLRFGYPGKPPVFDNLTFAIGPGLSQVQGGEGRGKTTLLKLICGDLLPQAGEITLGESAQKYASLDVCKEVFRTDPRSEALEQTTPLQFFESLTARYPRFDLHTAKDFALGLSLGEHLQKPMYMLSTGSKRKVWLAAAFAAGTSITLLDDPFSALDHRSIAFVMDLLQEAKRHPTRAWVLADYTPPDGVTLSKTIDLGD
jgi:ABC-type cobalamin/Fe3+-siderophores transport system ATPase subunit